MRNNKGFISIVGIIILAAAVVFGSVFVANELRKPQPPQPLRFVSDPNNLGAVVTPKFPTSTNNFAEGDVIEEEDWNAIEKTIGITGSASSTSLTYKLTSATSTDPGHKHSTSTITGIDYVKPISEGGTGTTSLTANNVILGNGTSTPQFVAPGSSGNTLTSNGTTWISGSTEALPVGSITAYATSTPPTGWLLANGQSVATTTYSALFAVIGYSYGGSTSTFALPDLRGRNVIGFGSATTTIDEMGEKGGEITHTQTIAEMPAHTHGLGGGSSGGSYLNATIWDKNITQQSESIGSGNAFNVMDPYIILNYIIKY